MPRPPGPLLLVLLVTSLALADCGGPTTPSPTPGDLGAVQSALALRGATIHRVVSGDPGCPDSALHSNAARLELTLAGDDTEHVVYLFRWRRPADFAAAARPFSDCVDRFLAQAEGDVPVEGVEVEPWRAYGPGWSEELIETLQAALHDARR